MSFVAVAIGGGALIGAIGSGVDGSMQAGASRNAAQLQYQSQQNALDFQKQEWQTQQNNMAPWLQQGQGAVNALGGFLGQAQQGQGPLAPWTGQFTAPTLAQAQNEPGYQFALSQGRDALTNSALASGNGLTGNTGEALQQYGQKFGEQNYQNVYNRAMQQYQQSYNQFEQGQANTFNRYASLAGLGQTAAGQLGSQGQAAAGNFANISLTGGQQIGNSLQIAAYQQASGYAGIASSLGNGLSNYAMWKALNPSYPPGQAPGGPSGDPS